MSVLELRDLSVSYGGVRALDGVSLDVRQGTILGLIGPNGAGKTTLIDGATGFAPATGQVLLDGRRIDGMPAHRRARLGVSRTWQGVELFADLSVRDNVRVAAERPTLRGLLVDAVRVRSGGGGRIDELLELVGIGDLGDARPSELSSGHQKLVGIARALMNGSTVVFLDEPAAGLDPAESDVLAGHLRVLVDRGVTVLLVEHDVRLVFGVCDEVAVLDHGVLIARGLPAEVQRDPAVVAAYLGSALSLDAEGES